MPTNPFGDSAVSTAGAPATMGPAGFWLDKDGNVAATDQQGKPQVTPGMRDNPESAIYYDKAKDLNYTVVNGQKLYHSPMTYSGQETGTGHGMQNKNASLLKTGGTWNPKTGEFDQSANWSNITSMVVAGLMTAGAASAIMGGAAPAAAGASGATSAAAGGGGALASTITAPTVGGLVAGGTGLADGAAAAGSAGAAAAAGGSLWSQAARLAGPIGSAIGKATSAAGNNRLTQEQMGLQANRDNIAGNTASENALMNRSEREAAERKQSLVDLARASYTRNPSVSQFNTHAPVKNSDEYMQGLTALEQQGLKRLKADPTYSTNNMPALRPYQPLDIANLQGATGTQPSLMEKIGQWASPAMTVAGSISALRRKQQNAADDALYGG